MMTDEAKLGLVAGVLAVVGVAVFGYPKEAPKVPANPPLVTGTATASPNLPPAAVLPAR
jgi:hypothetical protein